MFTQRYHWSGPLVLIILGQLLGALDTTVFADVLTNAAQIRALTQEQSSRGHPVFLQGVVLTVGGDSAVISDQTAGIYVEATNRAMAQFKMGDLIAVQGKTDPGKFAPIVKVDTVEKIGVGTVPNPQRVAFADLQTGRLDAQWIEVSGVVRRSEAALDDDRAWRVWVAVGEERLPVRLSAEQGRLLAVDSEVLLRGVCFYQFNKSRQAVSPMLQIPSGQTVLVTRAAPEDPFSAVERPVSSLLQFSTEDLLSHRVRVSGVVTHAVIGEGFWIRSGDVGLRVRSAQAQLLAVGDAVTVLGFLSRGDYSPVLEDAIFRKQGKAERPVPLILDSAQQALDHDQDLVQLDVQLIEQWRVPDGCRITLQDQQERFIALLRLEGHQQVPGTWINGSRVRVVGISSVVAGTKDATAAGTVDPGSFQIFLRSASDLKILQAPPWWTAEHIGWVATGVLSALLAGGGIWFRIHRQRVARQMEAMKAQAALDSERRRIARDLHDEIGANLTHISILSTLVSQVVREKPQHAQQHSQEAAKVAQQTIRAFDEILWSVNPKNDTPLSLGHYICRYAEENLTPAGINCRFELDETFPELLLPPNSRHGLLLVVKEVLHNIIKHAAAKRVVIQCHVEGQRLFVVRVKDDGCGMDLRATPPASGHRQGQGLQNLRARLQELGGECLVESEPGRGTEVSFRLPL